VREFTAAACLRVPDPGGGAGLRSVVVVATAGFALPARCRPRLDDANDAVIALDLLLRGKSAPRARAPIRESPASPTRASPS